MPEEVINYYEVLGVTRDASDTEIKQSFRRLAMKFHPDRNRSAPQWAEDKIRLIIKAYDTLIDEENRTRYDHSLDRHLIRGRTPVEIVAHENPREPGAQVRFLLQLLLDEKFEDAMKLYEEMLESHGPQLSLRAYLSERDYLDCLFLLGEAFESQSNWTRALEFYERVYNLERERPVRYFLEEVKERIRDIYCKSLARRSSPMQAINIYKKILEMDVPKKSEAYICKKIAENYFKMGNSKKAKEYLSRAFVLEPHLKGAQKICEKLGLQVGSSRSSG
ncbi:MAG TPA: tetratricopeptide repeat protein [Planctomycetes bacterium]|nr:tetratricopeptide repeat protein [Planctomycetota bacterium]